MRGRSAVVALLVALATATAGPASAQTPQELIGLTVRAAEDRLQRNGQSYEVNGLPVGVDRDEALVAVVDVVGVNDPDCCFFVLRAGTAVPDVVGRGLDDAQQAVSDVRLNPTLDPQPDDATAFDTDGLFVAGQSPEFASLVPFGTEVFLQYGVQVPDLRGLSSAEAEAQADDARLEVAASGPLEGVVASQLPPPDEVVEIGSTVDVVLEAVVVLVTVPNLRGLSPEDARRMLEEADLVLSPTIEGDPSSAIANGQTPAADAQVPRDSTVQASFAAPVVDTNEDQPPGDLPQSSAAIGLLVAVLVLTLFVAVTLTSRGVVRRRRERQWLREKVRYSAAVGQVIPPQLHELDPAASLSVRAEGRRDTGEQVLEEVHP